LQILKKIIGGQRPWNAYLPWKNDKTNTIKDLVKGGRD